ncbi:MAG: ribulose-phosphate 3-epimerase [Phycisphaera sp.]|nr:ribulose-phosphate 3-epimerase [Phycisphaera sp.]
MSNLLNNPPRLPMIFPSILGADFTRMGEDCAQVLELGAEALHVDVMDGHFVPNLSMGPKMVADLRAMFPDVYMDVHLMVTDPQDYVGPFAKAGANCITFHIEAAMGRKTDNEKDVLKQIRDAGCQAGIVIRPPTPPQAIFHLLDELDMILLMSVHPGFSGQSFMPIALDKARTLKPMLKPTTRLEIDGGLNAETAPQAIAAGVDVIVAASALFGAPDRAKMLAALRGEG